ncbi:MAG: protein kinase, partial [Actinomycetota bacterium]|nr:protein kinase [Actinomycetota bacterium]
GGMAKVYLAHDEVLDRDLALKVLRDQYAEDEEFVERFRQEARSAAGLSHPYIVHVYDQGRSEDGAYYIAMEYVPGGMLKDRIQRDGALDPNAAAGVASQITHALVAAHEKGVIHRDIKPQNVLVTKTGDVKVTDFGIARAASSTATATGTVLGTTGYMSPEQAMGEPVGPASDLYSLGVVLYEMLTGERPFKADSAFAQAMKHINEPPRSPREANPGVPETLDAVTVKLLAKNPEDRYASAAVLANDLDRVRSGLPPVAVDAAETEKITTLMPPLPPGGRTKKTTVQPPALAPAKTPGGGRRRRGRLLPLLAAALLGLTLLGGLVWTLTQGFDSTEPSDPEDQVGKGGEQSAAQDPSSPQAGQAAQSQSGQSQPGPPGTTTAAEPSAGVPPSKIPTADQQASVDIAASCYVHAVNAEDLNALVGCFSPEGVVVDLSDRIEGQDAIRRWADNMVMGGRLEVLESEPRTGGVRLLVHWAPEGSSGWRAYYTFEARDGRIVAADLQYA